jgi:hypothetical protein
MSAIREAIRLLREAADLRTKVPEEWIAPGLEVSTPRDMRAKLLTAAAALERLITDPSDEEVERAANAIVALPNFLTQGARNIARAALRSLGSETP